jgi:hypothetical protein
MTHSGLLHVGYFSNCALLLRVPCPRVRVGGHRCHSHVTPRHIVQTAVHHPLSHTTSHPVSQTPSLSRSIELKAYAQAVKYYSTARGVLNDHLDVPSFRNILLEADAIVAKLKADIQSWIQDDGIEAPKLAECVD